MLRDLTNGLTIFGLGFLRVARLVGGGGGWKQKVPPAYNSKTINDDKMKFGGAVKDYWLINLLWFKRRMTSWRHSGV